RGGMVFGRGPGFGHGPFGILWGDTMAAAATYLGLSLGDLRAELGAGKSLADIATAHGKTSAGLKAALTAAAGKDLDAAVAAGKLTRSQADDILSSLQQRFDDVISGQPAFGRGWRRGVMPIP